MYLALSYDHRLIDGREAVQFLVRIKECIERPGAAAAGSVTLHDRLASHARSRRSLRKPHVRPFDLVVIGAGPGGYVAAIRAAQLGMKVACVEKSRDARRHLPQRRLHPQQGAARFQRAVSTSAQKRFAAARHPGRATSSLDLPRMLARKDEVVKGLTDGVAFLFKKNKIAVVHGTGQARSARGQVARRRRQGERSSKPAAILLATGSEPAAAALPALRRQPRSSARPRRWPSTQVPEHLIVIGGGYIGLELGSVWARLGAKVTVLEFLPRILPLTDAEIAGLLHKSLDQAGAGRSTWRRRSPAPAKDAGEVDRAGREAAARRSSSRATRSWSPSAAGRTPAGLGLEEAGVARRGAKRARSSSTTTSRPACPAIYAIGDLIAGPMLAHKARRKASPSPSTSPASRRTSTTTRFPASSTPRRRSPRRA